jgi:hypothetical protein
MTTFNAGRRTQILHQLIATRHRATERATNPNVRFSRGFLAKHWIKSDQLKDIDRLEPEPSRDPDYSVIADKTEVLLPQVK